MTEKMLETVGRAPLVGDVIDPRAGVETVADSIVADGPLYSEEELSIWLQMPVSSVKRMRDNGTGPAFIRPTPRVIRYRMSDIRRWLELNKRQGFEAA